jgi:hypothetical protein
MTPDLIRWRPGGWGPPLAPEADEVRVTPKGPVGPAELGRGLGGDAAAGCSAAAASAAAAAMSSKLGLCGEGGGAVWGVGCCSAGDSRSG